MTATDKQQPFKIALPGTEINARLPGILQSGTRAADGAADPFIHPGFVEAKKTYDLSPAARSMTGETQTLGEIAPDDVLALELQEGVTVFIRADRLALDLAALYPAVAKEELNLDLLRQRAAATRGLGDWLIQRVTVLAVKRDNITALALNKLREWVPQAIKEEAIDFAGSYLGTKALMWAIESRLAREPGLYRWIGAQGEPTDLFDVADPRLQQDAQQGPLLVFIHGTASSTVGSFGKIRTTGAAAAKDWSEIEKKFGERIYAFEHRTFSESPIENALQLARALPAGAQLNIVTHSRGGLIGDLLCLDKLTDEQIAHYQRKHFGYFGLNLPDIDLFKCELEKADAFDCEQLRELRAVLMQKQFRIQRYLRAGCPARGTRLLSINLDLFLCGLLSLVGTVPGLAGNPIYSALKRIILEIAHNRTVPNYVPGIEAMLPESPLAALLMHADLKPGTELGIVAGDIEGGGLLKRLGVLLTDFALFNSLDNDLVVDTDSMYAGLARPGAARRRFEQGPNVNHFSYFGNDSSRVAIRKWLTEPNVEQLPEFNLIPMPRKERTLQEERAADRALHRSRGGDAAVANLPVVFVLPGTMGSHLTVNNGKDRIWFDPIELAKGGLARIQWSQRCQPEKLFDMFYGDLCDYLQGTHQVRRFPYDWRQRVEDIAVGLAKEIKAALAATTRPVRIVAHSMGGLVVRAMIAANGNLWKELMQRDGACFIMLGTPNQGSHLMVETLLGKADTMRKLATVDLKHDLQKVLDIVAEFRGALQLLPRPDFADVGNTPRDYFDASLWPKWFLINRDGWFGDRIGAKPAVQTMQEAATIWNQTLKPNQLPDEFKAKTFYVYGQADHTPCGLVDQNGKLQMLGTADGDGSVTWASGRIGGIGQFYHMPADHGSLPGTKEYFPAIVDLLLTAETKRLTRIDAGSVPARARGATATYPYDVGPVPYPTEEEIALSAIGVTRPRREQAPPPATLFVTCNAMDLRYVTQPILVGHYQDDAISGAESIIDRELVSGELSMRQHLGLYAGPIGTASAVLFSPNEQEQLRGSVRGAIVTGLGKFGELTQEGLTEAVRAGALRYLLQLVDSAGGARYAAGNAYKEVALNALLMGYNSTTNISIEDSVTALVRGVLEANKQFAECMHARVRISHIEIVECFLDTAIGAANAIKSVAARFKDEARRYGMQVQAARELRQGKGVRARLSVTGGSSYWPRMIVTERECPQECLPEDAPAKARKKFPERLSFVFLSQRARAETEMQQNQPGLVDKLVEAQIMNPRYSQDFACTLFQLLVPHAFKEAARQLDNLVLVLDPYTANIPWELMLADDQPLATRTAMVRQLSSSTYRQRVRSALNNLAYVVGNPSTEGFGKAFTIDPKAPLSDPPPLPHAEEESTAVARFLRANDFQVTDAIGSQQRALDVINGLYRHSYRIIHIAAHGDFEIVAADGSKRSGVLLSDGLLLTAAEIKAMEIVPDLVFLNCCYLGQVNQATTQYNKLAYSVARELIESGVRAVVVAGWAVDDRAARFFAERFYDELIAKNHAFGRAVFEARKETFQQFPGTNTWGAYQAYGDPGFRMSPRDPGSHAKQDFVPVAPEELLDKLDMLSRDIARRNEPLAPADASKIAGQAAKLLEQSPDGWRQRPEIAFALAQLYAELGTEYFDTARRYYQTTIQVEDKAGRSPLRAVEQLANIEARYAEEHDDLELIDAKVIPRLDALRTLESAGISDYVPNPERCALLGSAYKRKAAILARRMLAAPATARKLEVELVKALGASIRHYQQAEGEAGKPSFKPYLAANRISLQAVLNRFKADGPATTKGRRATTPGKVAAANDDLQTLHALAAQARENFANSPDFWNAVMPADARLTEYLLKATLDEQAQQAILATYDEALAAVRVTPKDLDSVVKHIELLAVFAEAGARVAESDQDRLHERLKAIAAHLQAD